MAFRCMGLCWEEKPIGTPGMCDHRNKLSEWCGFSGHKEGIIFNSRTHSFDDIPKAAPPPAPTPPPPPPAHNGSSGGERSTSVKKTEAESRTTGVAMVKRDLGTGKMARLGRYASGKWLQDLNQSPAEAPFFVDQSMLI